MRLGQYNWGEFEMIKRATSALACGVCMVAMASPGQAQTPEYNVPAGSLKKALDEYARQSGRQIIYKSDEVRSIQSRGAKGAKTADEALASILAGTGFRVSKDKSGAVAIIGPGDSKLAQRMGQYGEGKPVPVTGTVTDERTGANLKGALVTIEETGQTTKSDDLGGYRFPGVHPGRYTLHISYLGYRDIVTALTVEAGKGVSEKFAMTGGSDEVEIVVYGRASSRAQSLNQQRTAPNNSEVVSDDQLGNFTGTTVSEALRKVPGITFQQSAITGDGTNVIIRGLEPDLNTVTLNGLRLPDASGRGRSGNLSNILADSISKITVNKSLLPSQDSSGTGGLIEIETKSPLDRPKRYLNLSFEGGKKGSGYNDDFLASATASAKFGQNEQFGLSASFQMRERSIRSIIQNQIFQYGQYLPPEADISAFFADPTDFIDPRRAFPFNDGGQTIYPVSQSISSFESDTSNKTFGITAEWQVNDHSNLRLDLTKINATDSFLNRNGSDFYYSLYMPLPVQELNGEVRQALNYFNALNTSRSLNTQKSDEVTTSASLRGNTQAGKWHLTYGGGYSKGSRDYSSRDVYTGGFLFHDPSFVLPDALDTVEGRVLSIFSPITGGIQQPLFNNDGFKYLNDPQQHPLQNAGTNSARSSNERVTADMSVKYSFGSRGLKYLEGGLYFERSDYDTENRPGVTTFEQFQGSGATAADLGLNITNNIWDLIGGPPGVGVLSTDDIDNVFARLQLLNGNGVTVQSFNVDPRLAGEMTRENELSGYIEAGLTFGNLEIIGGVRVARVVTIASKLQHPTLRLADGTVDQTFAEANTEIVKYDGKVLDVLPRVLANYRPTSNLVIRGGYYLTVARPTIESLAKSPQIYLSLYPSGGPQFNQPTLSVSLGNPALRPAFTHNLDLDAELYTGSIGIIKVGGFYKRIENFIDSNSDNSSSGLDGITLPNDPRFQNLPANTYISVTRPENADDTAEIWGAELSIEHRFNKLPGILHGLGVYANYTYSDSRRDTKQRWYSSPVFDDSGTVIGREELDYLRAIPFFQQSKHSGTAAITYERRNFEAILSYSFQDRRLVHLGDSELIRDRFGFDTYADQLESLDLRMEYRMSMGGGRYRLWLEAQDLLDSTHDPLSTESFGGADGVPKVTATRNYLGGRSVKVGLSATF